MNEFYEGLIAGIAMLGGLCAFNYWVFNLMEKRMEAKLDNVSKEVDNVATDVHRIADELRQERLSKDALYKFVLDHYKTS